MIKLLQMAALAAAVAFGGALPMTAPAVAQGLQLELGRDGLKIAPQSGRTYRDRDRQRNRCDPDRALNKAERMGIRRARIANVGRRTVVVSGRTRDGERVRLAFGQARGCPFLG